MKILIAEDDAVSRRLLQARLEKWSYQVTAVADGPSAWDALQGQDAPALAVVDWEMPGLDGVELCRRIRRAAREPYVYVILLTSKTSSQDLIVGLEAGADDYLTKPFNPSELRVRLRAGGRIVELQEQLLAAREALSERALRDSLTGLWNRGAVLEAFGRELARAERHRKPLGVIMADIDHFKRVNDTFGHLAGDGVLQAVARRLSGTCRAYDALGRYGGEEFLVVAPECDVTQALGLAERLRATVAAEPIELPEASLELTMSFGVAVYSPASGLVVETLLRAADEALYRAKREGRNRVRGSEPLTGLAVAS